MYVYVTWQIYVFYRFMFFFFNIYIILFYYYYYYDYVTWQTWNYIETSPRYVSAWQLELRHPADVSGSEIDYSSTRRCSKVDIRPTFHGFNIHIQWDFPWLMMVNDGE